MVHASHISLAVISLDSSLKKDDNNHPQVFKKSVNALKKVIRHINDSLSDFSSLESQMQNKYFLIDT